MERRNAVEIKTLKDRVIIVTGGSRGIGRAIVSELAAQGASVVFTYVKQQALAEELVGKLNKEGSRVTAMQADVADFSKAGEIVEKTVELYGRLDGLVNNAGIVRSKPLMLMGKEDWQDVIETNLTGVFNACRAAIVTFMKQRKGRIVNISSVIGLTGMARQVNYAASKAGIIGLTKALAKEVAPYNITVNAIAPGWVETEMTAVIAGERKEKLLAQIPMGRFGRPEEIARWVTVLLSDVSSYMTGQVIVVDGGLS